MSTNNAPDFNVYTVEDRGKNEDPFWLKIGAAWKHKDGKGYNLTLSAFPPDKRLVLREPAADDGEEQGDTDKPQRNGRGKR